MTTHEYRTGVARFSVARVPVCATAILLLVAARSLGDDKKLDDKLSQLDERSKMIEDMTADFVEEKFTAMLKRPLVSKGRVQVKGSCTRWDTTEPHATTLFTDAKQVALYFPSRKTAEVYPIDRRLRPLIVSPVPRVATLRQHFFIEQVAGSFSTEFLLLRMTPKDDGLKEFIDEVRVEIDPAMGVARRFELIDPDGDRTVIEFTDTQTNVGLTDKDVACRFPPNTRIVRPLDPSDSQQPAESGSNPP